MADTSHSDYKGDCSDCGPEENGQVFIRHWGPLVPPGVVGQFGPKCWDERRADRDAGREPRPLGTRSPNQ